MRGGPSISSMAATLGGCRNDVIVRLTNSLRFLRWDRASPLSGCRKWMRQMPP
jgi:hypothetical protein